MQHGLVDGERPCGGAIKGFSSSAFTTFGCLFVDLNNDGWPDIATANGHIDNKVEQGSPVPLLQRPLFLINEDGKRFREEKLYERTLIGSAKFKRCSAWEAAKKLALQLL